MGDSYTPLSRSCNSRAADSWQSADIVDCILSYAATELVETLTHPGQAEAGRQMLEALRGDGRAAKQASCFRVFVEGF